MGSQHYGPIPSMHSPGFETAHCLPQAGVKPHLGRDIYRFNRPVPLYPPDPCVRPNEGDLLCPPKCDQPKRLDLLASAGTPSTHGDRFAFHNVRGPVFHQSPCNRSLSACSCPALANSPPCTSLGIVTDQLQCPCTNRMTSGVDHGHSNSTSSQNPCRGCYQQDNSRNNVMANGRIEEGDFGGHELRRGAIAPTPNTMATGGMATRINQKIVTFGTAEYPCQNPYYPSNYICRPVFDRKYLDDCPEQDGPSPDTYTFL